MCSIAVTTNRSNLRIHSMMLGGLDRLSCLVHHYLSTKQSFGAFVPYQLSGAHLIGDDGLRGSHWIYAPPGALA
jgi:hypothetical protein